MEASKNNSSNLGNNTTNISINQLNGTYYASSKHDPRSGWENPNPIPNDEVGQKFLNNAYRVEGNTQVFKVCINILIYDSDTYKKIF